MTSIDLIPTVPDAPGEEDVAAPEPSGNQIEEPSMQNQTTSLPEEVKAETKEEQSEVRPTPRRGRGRPPGAKNKTIRKTVKLEPVPLPPVEEEEKKEEPPQVAETPPVVSPTTRKREYMRELSLRRQAERQAKVAHYTSLLDRSLGY